MARLRVVAALFALFSAMGQTENWVKFEGEYRNPTYGYRASVPVSFTGYKAAAPAPSHGFAIDLAPDDTAHISVDGSYNATFISSARAAVETNLSWIRDKGRVIGKQRFQVSRLGGLQGVELFVKYRDAKTGSLRVCKAIAALEGPTKPEEGVGIVYEITLDTLANRLGQDERVWQEVLRSFQLLPR